MKAGKDEAVEIRFEARRMDYRRCPGLCQNVVERSLKQELGVSNMKAGKGIAESKLEEVAIIEVGIANGEAAGSGRRTWTKTAEVTMDINGWTFGFVLRWF